jgi:hypothetical protein
MTFPSVQMKQESIHGPKFIFYWNVGVAVFERARNNQQARFHNAETPCEGIIMQKRFVKKWN